MIGKKKYSSFKISINKNIRRGIVSSFFTICLFLFIYVTPQARADISYVSILKQSHYTTEQQDSLLSLFIKAEEDDIPSPLLLPRLEEGIAKKVSYERLIKVISQEIISLKQARKLLESLDPTLSLVNEPSIWLRTGILFSKGIPDEIIYVIASKSILRWEDYRDATSLYLSLTQWGLSEDEALSVVESLLLSKIPGQDFMGIIAIFTRARSLYVSPEEIIGRMKEVIATIETIEALEEKIMF